MYCMKCGAPNDDKAKFCIKCGHSLGRASALSASASTRKPRSIRSPAHSDVRLRKVWRAARIPAVVLLVGLMVYVAWRAVKQPDSVSQERTRETDGMVMVFVPGGEFLMGSTEAQVQDAITQCLADGYDEWVCEVKMEGETPQRSVSLEAFWIDKTEVTNAQYDLCVRAGACDRASCRYMEGCDQPDQPVVCVTWEAAKAYCRWAGGRLPTEEEWEKAARGTDGRLYPWGNTYDGHKVNSCDHHCGPNDADTPVDDGYGGSAPVGTFPAGASPYGALDMAGNVWEWVDDWHDRLSGNIMIRGGGWNEMSWGVRTAYSRGETAGGSHWLEGFRCMVP